MPKSRRRGRSIRANWIKAISFLVAAVLVIAVAFAVMMSRDGLKVEAADLMEGIEANKVEKVELSKEFSDSTADFSIDLFAKALKQGENCMVSPTSVYLALGMTANGAKGQTLKEFEELLGRYDLTVGELNGYYYSLAKSLAEQDKGKLSIANSIWYRNEPFLSIEPDFLQKNADYFEADAYKADFNSEQTANDINNWVKHNTGGMIDKIIDRINGNTVMYLINAMTFEAEWQKIYNEADIREGKFTLADGSLADAQYMYSEESVYVEHEKAKGFIKPYKGDKFSFVALLPHEDITAEELAASLSGKEFLEIIKNKKAGLMVRASIPKFETEYEIKLVDPLKELGLVTCFSAEKADFSKMANCREGELFVGDVLHKTFIKVDERGTKAGAATKVEIKLKSLPQYDEEIYLNRPFVYAIIDNETGLPLFMGTVNNPTVK